MGADRKGQGLWVETHGSVASYHWVRLWRWRFTYMWQQVEQGIPTESAHGQGSQKA